MVPLRALVDIAGYYLKVDNLREDQVLEIAVRTAIEKDGSLE
jgi:glutamate formiminotransferase